MDLHGVMSHREPKQGIPTKLAVPQLQSGLFSHHIVNPWDLKTQPANMMEMGAEKSLKEPLPQPVGNLTWQRDIHRMHVR